MNLGCETEMMIDGLREDWRDVAKIGRAIMARCDVGRGLNY